MKVAVFGGDGSEQGVYESRVSIGGDRARRGGLRFLLKHGAFMKHVEEMGFDWAEKICSVASFWSMISLLGPAGMPRARSVILSAEDREIVNFAASISTKGITLHIDVLRTHPHWKSGTPGGAIRSLWSHCLATWLSKTSEPYRCVAATLKAALTGASSASAAACCTAVV